jgi:ABC-type branched-subunit amino acid transport system ATPase component
MLEDRKPHPALRRLARSSTVSIMQAETGQVTCVMGTNGVGKTSLLKAISGVHPRSGGHLSAGRRRIGKMPRPCNWRARVLAMCRRARHLPVADGAREPGDRLCLPAAVRAPDPDEIFELFPCSRTCETAAAATCRAASSSNWHRARADHQAQAAAAR